MPNYVMNQISVQGDPKEIQSFILCNPDPMREMRAPGYTGVKGS